MPKIDGTHIVERLSRRLNELRQGEKVSIRDIRSLLTENQAQEIDIAWNEQKNLRLDKTATNDSKKKSKRDVHIAVLEKALDYVINQEVSEWDKRVQKSNVRQAKIYLKTYSSEKSIGKSSLQAKNKANNALTQAGLRRLDGSDVLHNRPRDKEVRDLEVSIEAKADVEIDKLNSKQDDILDAENTPKT